MAHPVKAKMAKTLGLMFSMTARNYYLKRARKLQRLKIVGIKFQNNIKKFFDTTFCELFLESSEK